MVAMKRLLLLAVTATMFAACSKDNVENTINLYDEVLRVSVGEEETRIQLNENCHSIWNEGDLVSVFNKTTGNECYKFDGKTGDREGTLSKCDDNAGAGTDKVLAIYPYQSEYAVSGNFIIATIPDTQTYMADSFGDGGNIMVASSEDTSLRFKHIFGWIKLNLTDDLERMVSTITFSGNNSEKLAGSVLIDADTQKVYLSGDNKSALTLDCGDGVQLSADVPTSFYIAILPQTFTNGVTVEVTMTDGTSFKKYHKSSFSITRNHIQPVKTNNSQPASSMILYTTSDSNSIIMNTFDGFGAEFISNTYADGMGIIQFDGDITNIPDEAFYLRTNLTGITIPESVTAIGSSAFAGCTGLTTISIPNEVTIIKKYAFSGCTNLVDIYIPESVTTIINYAFNGCSNLNVHITDLAKWCAVQFDGNESNPLYSNGKLYLNGQPVTDLAIPLGVTAIGNYAFCGCRDLTDVSIPNSVTSIGDYSFNGCSDLTDITIPNSVTSIGDYAFYECSGLTDVSIPDSVTFIGDAAFCACYNLTNIDIPDSITTIESATFCACTNLKDVTIPDSVTTIGDSAFSYCNCLTSITIPENVSAIGNSAFQGCYNLTSIILPESLTTIEIGAFSSCISLTSITLPESLTTIESSAFVGCDSLTSITIPESVTTIGERAFWGCGNLTTITIPASVTAIGNDSFRECSNLTNIYCKPTTPPTLSSDIFPNSPVESIYVPQVSVEAYQSANVWSGYASKIVGYDF